MTKKKIVLEDGRYLIYFSFTEGDTGESQEGDKEDRREKMCCGGKK